MKLDAFNECSNADDFIRVAGGDLRLAETAAWAFWEQSGDRKGNRDDRISAIAIDISNKKYQPSEV